MKTNSIILKNDFLEIEIVFILDFGIILLISLL